MADAEQFRKELEEFSEEEILGRAIKLQKRILSEVLTQVVQRTPVGNRKRWKRNIERAQRGLHPLPKGYVGGHARKNWQVTLNRRPTTEVDGRDARGQQTIDRGLRRVVQIDKPMIGYVSNLLPYMQRLEDGWSQSAPEGTIVRDTVRMIRRKYRRVR
ncbi:MAG: hypothetical protein CMF19_07030 [Idiomarinaceae bacterium]|nr:hypothetical protein [Idiomarinaceae bacterium]